MTNQTIIANWKMHGSVNLLEELATPLLAWAKDDPRTKAVICPPFPYVSKVKQALFESYIAVGGQDCHSSQSGAFTGNVSADMLVELGCNYVILGHSERRQQHGETDDQVAAKAKAALDAGLIPVICVGESLADRELGRAVEVVTAQAKASVPNAQSLASDAHFLLAYEPIWAIGSGRIPGMDDISEVHQALKAAMQEHVGADVPVLYGGSVKAANASDILVLPEVDGALVGGASLKKNEFLAILEAAEE